MGTVDVMMTADFTEMAMVVFYTKQLPEQMTMIPYTIMHKKNIKKKK